MSRIRAGWLAVLLGLGAWAAPPLDLGGADRQPLAGHLEILEGPPAAGLEEVLLAAAQGRFVSIPGRAARGYGKDPVWVRFTLRVPESPVPESWLEIQPGDLHRVTLYTPRPGGGYEAVTAGALVPFSGRRFPFHTAVFRLGGTGQALAGPEATCYLQLQTGSPRTLAPVLWSPPAFGRAASSEGVLFGALYGIAIMLTVANLLYWVKLRDPLQYQYAIYLVSMTLLVAALEGHAGQFLFPGSDWATTRLLPLAILLLPWVAVFIFSTLTEFGTAFPRLDRAYRVFGVSLSVFALLVSLPGRYFQFTAFIQLGLLLVVVCNLTGSVVMAARGHRTATFYLLAFSPYMVGALFRLARNFSWADTGFLGDYGMDLGAIAHFGLMALPMADRLGRLRRERDLALQSALEATRHHERELEGKVEARTQELQEEQARTAEALVRERQAGLEQRQFLSMVSHEFRTPLAVMDGAAQMARLSVGEPPSDLVSSTRSIQHGVRGLLHLLDTWLTSDRIASGLRPVQASPADLPAFLEDQALQAQEISRRDIRIVLEGLPPRFSCDRDLMGVALQNLLDNALKYSPADAPILLRGCLREGWLRLEVVDRGRGIPADQLGQITSRFFRGRNVGHTPGMGLGLDLVRIIAELHGGRLELESVEGQGTTARLMLPVRGDQAPA